MSIPPEETEAAGFGWMLAAITATPDGNLSAEARISAGSSWYDGHFPGSPILPGLAQLSLVQALVRQQLGARARIRSLSRVRFRRVLRPDEPLRIFAASRGGGSQFQFKITTAAEIACSGVLTIDIE